MRWCGTRHLAEKPLMLPRAFGTAVPDSERRFLLHLKTFALNVGLKEHRNRSCLQGPPTGAWLLIRVIIDVRTTKAGSLQSKNDSAGMRAEVKSNFLYLAGRRASPAH